MRAQQRLRDDVAAERAAFAEWQAAVDGHRVVCVDESGVLAGMRTAYGYAPRGARCIEHAPYRKGRRTSLIGWVRAGEPGGPGPYGKVVGVEGSVDGALFTAFVRDHLAPYLHPGDVVVWDNHRIHQGKEVRRLIEAAGATLHPQPRYSGRRVVRPEVNGAEPLWSKVKGLVRRARADTAAALDVALRSAVEAVTASDVAGWMRHCGYHLTSSA